MVPLQIPGGLGGPEIIIILSILLLTVGVPLLLVALVVVPFVRGWVGESERDPERGTNDDALRARVADLEAEVERLHDRLDERGGDGGDEDGADADGGDAGDREHPR